MRQGTVGLAFQPDLRLHLRLLYGSSATLFVTAGDLPIRKKSNRTSENSRKRARTCGREQSNHVLRDRSAMMCPRRCEVSRVAWYCTAFAYCMSACAWEAFNIRPRGGLPKQNALLHLLANGSDIGGMRAQLTTLIIEKRASAIRHHKHHTAGFQPSAVMCCMVMRCSGGLHASTASHAELWRSRFQPRQEPHFAIVLHVASTQVDIRDGNGATPLLRAAATGVVDTARALVAARADLQARSIRRNARATLYCTVLRRTELHTWL